MQLIVYLIPALMLMFMLSFVIVGWLEVKWNGPGLYKKLPEENHLFIISRQGQITGGGKRPGSVSTNVSSDKDTKTSKDD